MCARVCARVILMDGVRVFPPRTQCSCHVLRIRFSQYLTPDEWMTEWMLNDHEVALQCILPVRLCLTRWQHVFRGNTQSVFPQGCNTLALWCFPSLLLQARTRPHLSNLHLLIHNLYFPRRVWTWGRVGNVFIYLFLTLQGDGNICWAKSNRRAMIKAIPGSLVHGGEWSSAL